jgi:hypothetical protein
VSLAEDIAEIFEEAQGVGRRVPWRMAIEYGPIHRRSIGVRQPRQSRREPARVNYAIEPLPVERTACPHCGGVLEHRTGGPWPIHLGRGGCMP